MRTWLSGRRPTVRSGDWRGGLVVTIGYDESGPYSVIECQGTDDEPHCDAHQSVRPADLDTTTAAMIGALLDFAEHDGWNLDRGALCPRHYQ